MTGIATIPIAKFMLAAAVSAAVVLEDIRHRRISNVLCAVLFISGALSSALCRGWSGLADGVLGAAVGFIVFLVPYGLGGLGGGDVKLMCGFGALTGLRDIVPALILVSVAGAVTSGLYLLCSRLRGHIPPAVIPYAPAVAAGNLLVLFSQVGAR